MGLWQPTYITDSEVIVLIQIEEHLVSLVVAELGLGEIQGGHTETRVGRRLLGKVHKLGANDLLLGNLVLVDD